MFYRGRRDVETYRSGRNEPHSKCGYAFTGVREFESLRFRQSKPKSNTRVFGMGFSFAKIQVLSAFFGCRRAAILSLSGFVWECSYPFVRSSCRRFYAAKGSWATERSVSGRFVRNTLCFVSELEKCKFKHFTFFGQIYCIRRRQLHCKKRLPRGRVKSQRLGER